MPEPEAIFDCRPNLLVSDLAISLRFYSEAWGMYEMRLHDPDGHVLRVSSPPAGIAG